MSVKKPYTFYPDVDRGVIVDNNTDMIIYQKFDSGWCKVNGKLILCNISYHVCTMRIDLSEEELFLEFL